MSTARAGQVAVLLPNGKVLVAGGAPFLASAELYNPATNSWSSAGSMSSARDGHTATLLRNGKVLVVGGGPGTSGQASAELYNPATNSWSSAASMSTPRSGHTATLLPNGKVLVAGGTNGPVFGSEASAELYDPATNSWSSAGSMEFRRAGHSATLLRNGKVLVAGGTVGGGVPPHRAELYDPTTNSWSSAGDIVNPRAFHVALLRPDGRVLIAFGQFGLSTELYDPATNSWSMAEQAAASRFANLARGPASAPLPDGRVLVAGGSSHCCIAKVSPAKYSSAEIYDPATGHWSSAGCMATERESATATLLPNGKVLVAGGGNFLTSALSSAELYTPTAVPQGSGCTLTTWGFGAQGELGNGGTHSQPVPDFAFAPGYLLSVSAGFSSTAAVALDHTVWTWGDDEFGQLGDGATANQSKPVRAIGLTGVKAVSSGKSHVLALKSDGTVWSWGDNSGGQLGYGTICGHDCVGSTVPRRVPGLSNIVQVAAGGFHSLALRSDGKVFSWGQGGQGQLGTGYLANTTTPTAVPGLGGLTIKSIYASVFDSMVVTTAGRLWGWGGNGYSEVRGDGRVGIRSTPLEVPIGSVASIAQGRYFTVVLKTDGSVWTWGRNEHGQLGRGTVNVPTWNGVPARVPGLSDVTAVSAQREFALAMKRDGSVWAWGYGADGEIGNDTSADTAVPAPVTLPGVQARSISAGSYHAVAITP